MNTEELLNWAAALLRQASRLAEMAAMVAGGKQINRADLESARDRTRELLDEIERRVPRPPPPEPPPAPPVEPIG